MHQVRDIDKRVKAFLQGEWERMTARERALYTSALRGMKQAQRWDLEAACRALDLVDSQREVDAGRGGDLLPETVAALARYTPREAATEAPAETQGRLL